MIRAERHERILAELARKGAVSAQELSGLLGASLATIRRDISELDQNGSLLRTHGGASLPKRREELPYDAKMMSFLPEKRRIGAAAASDLEEGSVVGMGGGTTVLQMLPALRHKTLKLVTTAINIAMDLRDTRSIEVTLTGGVLRRRTAETVGHIAERTLRDLNIDVTVIGVDGLHIDKGLTTYDSSEAYVNRVMAEQAREVWVVADNSKIGEVFPANIIPVENVTRIYTDTDVDDATAQPFLDRGIDLRRV
ncbi:DeoR family transcriptional regulator [Aliiruegeria haliotis]|uniref:DeoR family transcriptional regulator n=1 Tax=Aliiruegeria haliotis TaxID=1280846 RepID=A0A2T0REE9_9RHOB|nr:DeoR/GlpR family DNA-binding transcription regulator [Aliiruegeria haliotis]PRY19535.1 DeoR family transcriptional regulator [Aliiruegeria haliotis]